MRGHTTEYTGSVKTIVALGNSLIVSGTFNGTIKCWWIDTKTMNAECLDLLQGPSNLLTLSVLDNGWVLCGFSSGGIMCWEIDKETGKAGYLDTWGWGGGFGRLGRGEKYVDYLYEWLVWYILSRRSRGSGWTQRHYGFACVLLCTLSVKHLQPRSIL